MTTPADIQDVLRVCAGAELGTRTEEQLRDAVAAVGAWDTLAPAAERHGVAPLVYKQLKRAAAIPGPQSRQLQALCVRHRRANQTRFAVLERLLAEFRTRDIPVALLKGAALAHQLYDDSAERPMRDLDILVRATDLPRAAAALRSDGFVLPDDHGSPFIARHHHLPTACLRIDGFVVSVEVHHDTVAGDVPASMKFEDTVDGFVQLTLSNGTRANTLGPTAMLCHLARHGFEPADEIRLIHLLDLLKHAERNVHRIDWKYLHRNAPAVCNALRCAHFVLEIPPLLCDVLRPPNACTPAGAGRGMRPLSRILRPGRPVPEMARELLSPPPWWLHGYYGVPPERSLLGCRLWTHPARVSRWLGRRAVSYAANRLQREPTTFTT